jgi:hypothetical protein
MGRKRAEEQVNNLAGVHAADAPAASASNRPILDRPLRIISLFCIKAQQPHALCDRYEKRQRSRGKPGSDVTIAGRRCENPEDKPIITIFASACPYQTVCIFLTE